MKIYLYYIKGIPKLEDYVDRKLICSSDKITINEEIMILEIQNEDSSNISKLIPGKNYMVMYEHDNGQKESVYFKMTSFEIENTGTEVMDLSMYVSLFD